jgi:SAM-dependent methyltransferase
MTPELPHGFKRWSSLAGIQAAADALATEWRGQQAFQDSLLERASPEGPAGFCVACGTNSHFAIDHAGSLPPGAQPNWRETLRCPGCGLINRWRASLHLFELCFRGKRQAPIYLTEEVTPLYQAFSERYRNVVGSEFVSPTASPGSIVSWHGRRVRHEDATALSFADASLAAVASFDVLEHIPDYRRALSEFSRVLARGGLLLLTAPFMLNEAQTRIRARVDASGNVCHLMPPVYHGDPINGGGVLCYQEFGWDLADALREAGFIDVELITCWAPNFGYYDSFQSFFVARKRGELPLEMAAEGALPETRWHRFQDDARDAYARFRRKPAVRYLRRVAAALQPHRLAQRWQREFGSDTPAPLAAQAAVASPAVLPPPAQPTRAADAAVASSGVPTYEERVAAELATFSDMVNVHDLPDIFHYWSCKYLAPRLEHFGYSHPQDFFAREIARQRETLGRPVRAISVGAGNGDIEIDIARLLRERGVDGVRIECLDINPTMLARCREMALAQGLQDVVVPVVGDFNQWVPEGSYDVVLASQSLHHVVELEKLFDAVATAIAGHGVFLISDTIGRNGHLRWPEALAQVRKFWEELPERKRYNLQLKRMETEFQDWDCSTEGFEGVRAQDILPLLIERFKFEVFIPWSNVVDIFIDRAFGHHQSIHDPADCAFIDRIHACDDQGILDGRWKPTHMIGVLRREYTGTPRLWQGLTPEFCVRRPD